MPGYFFCVLMEHLPYTSHSPPIFSPLRSREYGKGMAGVRGETLIYWKFALSLRITGIKHGSQTSGHGDTGVVAGEEGGGDDGAVRAVLQTAGGVCRFVCAGCAGGGGSGAGADGEIVGEGGVCAGGGGAVG